MLTMPNVDIEFWFVGQDHVTQHWIIYMCIQYMVYVKSLSSNSTLFSPMNWFMKTINVLNHLRYKICICNRQIECERNEIEEKKINFFRIYFSCFPCIIHSFVCCLATNPPEKKQPIWRLYSFAALLSSSFFALSNIIRWPCIRFGNSIST